MDIKNFTQLKKYILDELSEIPENHPERGYFVIKLVKNIKNIKTKNKKIKTLQDKYTQTELTVKLLHVLDAIKNSEKFEIIKKLENLDLPTYIDGLITPNKKKVYAMAINLKIPPCKIGNLDCVEFNDLEDTLKELAIKRAREYNKYCFNYFKNKGTSALGKKINYNKCSYLIMNYESIEGFAFCKQDCFQYFESNLGFLLMIMTPFPNHYDLFGSFSKNIQIFSAKRNNEIIHFNELLFPVWVQEYSFDETKISVFNEILNSNINKKFKRELLTSFSYIFQSQSVEPYLINLQGALLISAYESLLLGHNDQKRKSERLANYVSAICNDPSLMAYFKQLYKKRSKQNHGANRIIDPSDYNSTLNFSIDEMWLLFISFSNIFFDLWKIIKEKNIKSRKEFDAHIQQFYLPRITPSEIKHAEKTTETS